MDKKLVHLAMCVALTAGMVLILFVNVAVASSDNDPRSDKACDKMLDLEGRQNERVDTPSILPDSEQGAQKAYQGSTKALGDCSLER